MAVLIAQYGLGSLINLAYLLLVMLVSCLIFIFGILGLICYFAKVNIFKFMRFISRKVLIVFATSSSESTLAPLMRKLEKAGLSKATVGLVLPTGYSFNLDCTNIYLAMSLIFLAQAFNVNLSLAHEISILIVLMIASKGAVGVTGSGFIVLGSTLAALGNMEISEANATLAQVLPVAAIGVLLGVDKFMSEMRAVGNLCGNSVAALIVAIWDKQIDWEKFRYALDNPEKIPQRRHALTHSLQEVITINFLQGIILFSKLLHKALIKIETKTHLQNSIVNSFICTKITA